MTACLGVAAWRRSDTMLEEFEYGRGCTETMREDYAMSMVCGYDAEGCGMVRACARVPGYARG
eukprot:14539098-Alexandrium_andersonii.AAC.1